MLNIDIKERHQEFFLDFGFEFNPNYSTYEKSFPLGKQAIFVHFTEYPDTNYLEYNLGVRIDTVEELIHRFLPSLSDYSSRSLTLIQTPNKIDPNIPNRFAITSDFELEEALIKAEKFFIKNGFKWLDKMSHPLTLENAFVAKENYTFKSQNFIYNAFRATALAKLYKPEDYLIVRENFLNMVEKQQVTPFTIASYLQFLSHLDQEV